jgi:hypothetical protein
MASVGRSKGGSRPPSNVTEVDFVEAARFREIDRDPMAAQHRFGEEIAELRELAEEVAERDEWWRQNERRLYRRRIRDLRRQLQLERAGQFTDTDVLAALTEVGGEASASDVASRLLTAPSHSAVVRVGLALGRLNRAGQIGRIPPKKPSAPHRWFAMEAFVSNGGAS